MTEPQGIIIFTDDEESVRIAGEQWLSLAGFEVRPCASAEQALEQLGPDFPGILVTDVRMPRMDGLALLRLCRQQDPDLPVVLMTGHGDVAMAVQAMRDGAYDFLEKPFAPETMVEVVRRALEKRALVMENRLLRSRLRQSSEVETLLLGQSRAMSELRETIAELADTNANVLILGETGAGKEQVARCLHLGGKRGAHPLVALNCAAMPESIFESELFGHEAGAFTGAVKRRIGKLEHAHRGSLFLDEIESMPLSLQVKLLRVLQERVVERLGSNELTSVDFRVIAATKADLLEESRQGRFREDLYYRLNVAQIRIPPLRERREDIPLLFAHFSQLAAVSFEREAPGASRDDLHALMAHSWPGNVRELKNIAERFVLGGGKRPLLQLLSPGATGSECSFGAQMDAFERTLLEQELARHQGDIQAVLEALQMPRRTLNEKMRKFGLCRRHFR